MSIFLFQTRGETRPEGKPRVYFTCHPKDFDKYFGEICKAILNAHDCVIYYTANMSITLPEIYRSTDLGSMNLFVIPVTIHLLTESCRAISEDFAFAKEHHIPVLPLMMETGMDELYSRIFGKWHYLEPYAHDLTARSYEDKLKKFLSSVLLDEETTARIRAAFDAYIFLSYRKKDRHQANELMQLIHKDPKYRDIAIWYDEYLTPGEDFDAVIQKALNDSQLFTLLVTPSLVEEDNYVQRVEYPAALRAGKPIFPAEMQETDHDKLNEMFSAVPACVNPHDDALLHESLFETIKGVALSANDDDPEHNYLIGLAYRDGIDVEVNRERGMELITKAAMAGYPEAAQELVSMYYYGLGMPRNMNMAQSWQRKLINVLRSRWNMDPSAKNGLALADSLRFLTEVLRSGVDKDQTQEECIACCTKALDLYNNMQCADENETSHLIEGKLNSLRSLAIAYEDSGNFDAAFTTYQEALRLRTAVQNLDTTASDESTQVLNKWRIAQIHHDIGILYERKDEYRAAVEEFEDALTIYEDITKSSVAFVPNMIAVHNAIAADAKYFDIGKATTHCDTALSLGRSLFEAQPQMPYFLYARSNYLKAVIMSDSGQLDDAEIFYLKAKELLNSHREEGSRDVLTHLMNIASKLAGIYFIKGKKDRSERLYQESSEIACVLLDGANFDCKESIAHMYFNYGTFLSMYSDGGSLRMADECLQKAWELFADVSRVKASCQMCVVETELAIRKLGKRQRSGNPYSKQRKSNNASNNDVKTTQAEIGALLIKGERAEQEQHYEKALLNYQTALQTIERLGDARSAISNLDLADLYDRIAVCYEATQNFSVAKEHYTKAALVSVQEAMEAESPDAFSAAIIYVQKLISFSAEFGNLDEAEKHRQFRAFLEGQKAELTNKSNAAVLNANDARDSFVHDAEISHTDPHVIEAKFDELFGISNEDDFDIIEEARDIEARFDELFGCDDNPHLNPEDPWLMTLTDENGQNEIFRFVDVIAFESDEYVCLVPVDGDKVVIFRVVANEEDGLDYLPVEDEDLLTHLFEMFKEKNKNNFNFVD